MKKHLFLEYALIFPFLLLGSGFLMAQELSDDGSIHQINFSGSVQNFIIPANTVYDRLEFYLDGGDGGKGSDCNIKGGKGARAKVVFDIAPTGTALRPGGTIRFIVGERGRNRTGTNARGGGGGGGGTAVLYKTPGASTDFLSSTDLGEADNHWVILAVAGGGGGAFQRKGNYNNCQDNSKRGDAGRTTNAGGGQGSNTGGSDGTGGLSSGDGGAGGGRKTSGKNQQGMSFSHEGQFGGIGGGNGGYFVNGSGDEVTSGKGGWGYGGGGAGRNANNGGGGGGGGYSGGAGGHGESGERQGFGGGSFVNTADVDALRSLAGGGTLSDPQNGYITYKFGYSAGLIAKCKDVTVQLGVPGQQTFLAASADDGSYTTDGSTIVNYAAYPITGGVFTSFDFDCNDLGDHEFVLVVIPNAGVVGECSFTVTVEDNVGPTAQCKDATLQLNVTSSSVLLPSSVDDGSIDPCSPYLLTLDKYGFNCSDIGTNTVELKIRDEDDNTATCTASVTVQDVSAPELSCSFFPVTIQLNASGMQTITPQQVIFQESDNCNIGTRVLSQSIFTCIDVGANTVTVTVGDAAGNANTCTASVVVEENTAPTAVCQNATVVLDNSGNGSLMVTEVDDDSSDNCGIQSRSLSQSNFTCGDVGTVTVLLTVTDQGGNSSICTANVLVEGNFLPTAVCQDATIAVDDQGEASLQIADVDNGSSHICDPLSLSINPTDFDCSQLGSQEVTLTVTDQDNNQSTCTATVTVEDNIPPVAICKDETIQIGDTGSALFYPSDFNDGSYDNCGSISINNNSVPIVFDCDDLGGKFVNLTVSDGNLTSSCTATVIVLDNVAPYVFCKPATVQLDDTGMGTLLADQIIDVEVEVCTVESRTLSQSIFDCSHIGEQEVILTTTDQSLNSATCSATVTVVDEVPPVAQCKDRTIDVNDLIIIFPGDGGPPALIDDNSYDNCGNVSLSFEKENGSTILVGDNGLPIFSCNFLGTNTVILTASDGNLSSTCSASLTVVDNQSPYVFCQPTTLPLDETGNATLFDNQVILNSGDKCGISSKTLSQSQFDCSDIGTHTVTVTVTDNSGNTNTCSSTVTVENNSDLNAICQPATIELDETGNASIEVEDIDNGSGTACGPGQSINLDQTEFSCTNLGANTVVLTATDDSGNTSTCSATVYVEDQLAPSIICPGNVNINTDPGLCGATFTLPMPTTEDNCEVTLLRYRVRRSAPNGMNLPGAPWSAWSTSPTRYFPVIGYWKIQWEATDESGNVGRCFFLVNIRDQEPPTPVCLNSTVTFTGEAEIVVPSEQLWDETAPSDNCGLDPDFFEVPDVTITCDQIGSVIPVTVTVRDYRTNPGSCIANITVQGLPCGWQSGQINCSEYTQAGYDPTTATYNLSAQDCYDPNFYSNSEAQGIIHQELCGDGEIIAHVADIDGDAWAGIFMRENNDPSAKMLQLAVNNSGLAQRQLRLSTGSLAYKHLFQNLGKYWLRLTRSGNQFGAFISLDGIYWEVVLLTNIPMGNCIQTGLFLSNGTPGNTATAWFDQVEIKPPAGNALQSPIGSGQLAVGNSQYANAPTSQLANDHHPMNNYPQLPSISSFNFTLYPNPTDGDLNLVLDDFMGQPLQVRVFNQQGQILFTQMYGESHAPTEKLRLDHLQNGLYLLRIKVRGQYFNQKINIIH